MKSISSGVVKMTKVDGETETQHFGGGEALDYVINKKAGKKEEQKRRQVK